MDKILMKWLKQLEYTLGDTMPEKEDEPDVCEQQSKDLVEIKQLIEWQNNKPELRHVGDPVLICPFCESKNTEIIHAVSYCECGNCGKDFES